jgi:hypothetical protein
MRSSSRYPTRIARRQQSAGPAMAELADALTAYDYEHLVSYLRLDAEHTRLHEAI